VCDYRGEFKNKDASLILNKFVYYGKIVP
jgi:hypothetical protein